MIPDDHLDELERLANAATPGPWVNPDGYCVRHVDRDLWRTVCLTWKSGQTVEQGIDDMEFIAAARTAVPVLIAEVRRLREAIKTMLANPTGHYDHHDPLGTAGANCSACRTNSDNHNRLRAALNAKEADK